MRLTEKKVLSFILVFLVCDLVVRAICRVHCTNNSAELNAIDTARIIVVFVSLSLSLVLCTLWLSYIHIYTIYDKPVDCQ